MVRQWYRAEHIRRQRRHVRPGRAGAARCMIVSVAVLVALVIGAARVWKDIRPHCTHAVIDRLPSPDGSWVAVIDEETCDVGLLAMVNVTAGVYLETTTAPVRHIDLLGVETGGNHDERPDVVWTAPDVLRITVDVYAFLKIVTTQVDGVQVDVRFDPDDPVAREAWVRAGEPNDPPRIVPNQPWNNAAP